jgi:cytochrome c biogenesis protein CcmG/thiol:disulfide interchange protein DsbE
MKNILVRLSPIVLTLCLTTPGWSHDMGKPAPQLTAKLLDGDNFNLSQEIGNVVIINFWASWCAPCREEMPALETYYSQHKGEGLKIVAVSMDDPADEAVVRKIMSTYSYPAAFKREANYKGYGRIWRMPMTFVIDRQGLLRKDGSVGEPKVDLPTLEKIVTPLLTSAH